MTRPRHSGESRNPVTDHLDLWTSALLVKSTAGRGSNGRLEAYGIKKLLALILELAVRGKLVPQDTSEEPAEKLLRRIGEVNLRLIKKGLIKQEKLASVNAEEERIYSLPKGWGYARLAELTSVLNGRAYAKDELLSAGTPILRVGNLFTSDRWYYSNLELEEDKYCDSGDLLFAWSASFGPFIWPGPKVIYHYHIWKLKLHSPENISKHYLYKFLLEKTQEMKASGHGVSMIHMTKQAMEKILVPVPPLAEQHRIVAKVNELMALCDQLEQQQGRGIEAHQTLVETLLDTLTRVESAQEFAAAWNRITEHFDNLFTTEHSIDQLKQAILQLAVMGKLVQQESKDEPTSMLLENVAKTKRQKGREKRAKKDSQLPEVGGQDMPFRLPVSWKWARFGWLVNFRSELVRPEDFPDLDQVAPDSIEKCTGKLLFRRTVSESGVRGPNNRFYAGQILYSKIRPSLSKAIIAEFDGLCSADMYPMDSMIDSGYLLKAILSEPFLEQVRVAENRIKMPKLNVESLSCMTVPVPPLNEQHRIVAKVDELMALCDALKARLAEAQATQICLADAIVERAVAAPEAAGVVA